MSSTGTLLDETVREERHGRGVRHAGLTVAEAVGGAIMSAEDATLDISTNRLLRFRMRHPKVYGLLAFIIGGGVVALFTMSTYANWAYQSVDLRTALYQVVLGGLFGGLVLLALAFAYAAAIRSTLTRPPAATRS
jgi:hypothetical protein